MEAGVVLERRGPTALVRLDRPQAGNAIDGAAMEAFEGILDTLDERRDVASMVLTAAGDRTFCAGGDLAWFSRLRSRRDGLAMSLRMQRLLDRLWEGPRFVVAAVNGKALGGGCELLTACHYRLAVPEASFRFVQAANGVVTGWGGGRRLIGQLGRSRALELLVTARPVEAAEAERLGLVERLVPRERLLAAALEIADRVAACSPRAVAGFLELARAVDERASAARRRETELFAELWTSREFRALLDRFGDGSR